MYSTILINELTLFDFYLKHFSVKVKIRKILKHFFIKEKIRKMFQKIAIIRLIFSSQVFYRFLNNCNTYIKNQAICSVAHKIYNQYPEIEHLTKLITNPYKTIWLETFKNENDTNQILSWCAMYQFPTRRLQPFYNTFKKKNNQIIFLIANFFNRIIIKTKKNN